MIFNYYFKTGPNLRDLKDFLSSMFWILKLHILASSDLLWRLPHRIWQTGKLFSPFHSFILNLLNLSRSEFDWSFRRKRHNTNKMKLTPAQPITR